MPRYYAMMPELRFFFSAGSRYSYLAMSQLPSIEKEYDVEFDWIPITGGKIRALRGADPFKGPPQSGQYDWAYRRRDAEAWAAYYQIAFLEPKEHQFDADLLSRGAIIGKRQGRVREFSWQLASEVYARGTWPLDETVVFDVAKRLGMDVNDFAARLNSKEVIDTLDANVSSAFEAGVFGTPSFFIGTKMFWGNDRIPLIRHELANSHGETT